MLSPVTVACYKAQIADAVDAGITEEQIQEIVDKNLAIANEWNRLGNELRFAPIGKGNGDIAKMYYEYARDAMALASLWSTVKSEI